METNQKLAKDVALKILNSRKTITQPKKYEAKVTNVTPYFEERGGRNVVAIVNFNLMSPYHVKNAVTLMQQGEYDKACQQNLSTGVLEGNYIPSKGEIVEINVVETTTASGVTGLFVEGPIIHIKAEKAISVNFEDLLASATEGVNILKEEEEEVEVSSTSSVFK